MTAKILQITPKVGIEFCASRPDFSPSSCGISCITQEVSIFLFLKTRFLSFTPEQTVHKPDTKLRNKTYLSIVAVSNWVINETIFQNSVHFLFFNQPAEQIDLKFATRRLKSGVNKFHTAAWRYETNESEKTKPGSYRFINVEVNFRIDFFAVESLLQRKLRDWEAGLNANAG